MAERCQSRCGTVCGAVRSGRRATDSAACSPAARGAHCAAARTHQTMRQAMPSGEACLSQMNTLITTVSTCGPRQARRGGTGSAHTYTHTHIRRSCRRCHSWP